MKVLLDNGTPKPIARALPDHDVTYARRIGWHELANGDLIQRAEVAGYDVLLSTDKNIQVSAEPVSPDYRPGSAWQLTMAPGPPAS